MMNLKHLLPFINICEDVEKPLKKEFPKAFKWNSKANPSDAE